jgi:hypothetical protein
MDRGLAEDQTQLPVSIDFRQLNDAIYPSISAAPNERVFNFGGNVFVSRGSRAGGMRERM